MAFEFFRTANFPEDQLVTIRSQKVQTQKIQKIIIFLLLFCFLFLKLIY